MLDQVIFTRCFPQRELKNKGQVAQKDGFGVFTMSRELFDNPGIKNYDYLSSRLALKNGAQEDSAPGLFGSYEYTMLSPDTAYLAYEFAYPKCQEARANGKTHRSGNYIKQALIGTPQGYPAEWFGASAFGAYRKSQNDFYLEGSAETEPALLPQAEDTPEGGYITWTGVRNFVQDGRADAVKAALWFLLQQYSLPESQRKVLLIRDTPQNVELWIAAIEFAFPPALARKITFSTNRSRLGTQIDHTLFYYTDPSGAISLQPGRSSQAERRPVCMIVGFHPEDPFCSSINQMSVSNFVLLDGKTKTIGVTPDNSVNAPYYSAVVQYDADIQDFSTILMPSLPMDKISPQISALFDSYKYLLDSNHGPEKWAYSETVSHLKTLLQFGMLRNDLFLNYLEDGLMKHYGRFSAEDRKNNFTMMDIMQALAKHLHREREVTGCVGDLLGNALNGLPDTGKELQELWDAFRSSRILPVVEIALRELFNDTELRNYYQCFAKEDPSTVNTQMDMFFHMLSREKEGIASATESSAKCSFIYTGISALLPDHEKLLAQMKTIRQDSDLFNHIATTVAGALEKNQPQNTAYWWNVVVEAFGDDLDELCQQLCTSKTASIQFIEHLLVYKLRKTRQMDPAMVKAFRNSMKKLPSDPNTGVIFFGSWINLSSPAECDHVITAIRESKLRPEVEVDLFHQLDEKMPILPTRETSSTAYYNLKQWAKALHQVSRSGTFNEFLTRMQRISLDDSAHALQQANAFMSCKFSVNPNFTEDPFTEQLVAAAAEFMHPQLHASILSLYQNSDSEFLERYADIYVSHALQETKPKYLVPQLLSLTCVSVYLFNLPEHDETYQKALQTAMDKALKKNLPTLGNLSKLVRQVEAYPQGRDIERNKLLSLLEEAQKQAPKKHSFLGGLFG